MARGSNPLQQSGPPAPIKHPDAGQVPLLLSDGPRSRPIDPSAELPDFEGLLVELPVEINDHDQREQLAKLVCYWAKLPYVSNGTSENRWLSGRHFWLDASSYNSRSRDWRSHNIFAELEQMLAEGTPVRKRDGRRAVAGLGLLPTRFILSHDGQQLPRSERSRPPRRQRPPRRARSGRGLLYPNRPEQ